MAAKPGFVVGVQGFAIGEAEQCGAIVDLGGQLGGWSAWRFGDRGEPGAEGLAVLRGVEAEKIGGSVGVAVAGVEDEGYRNDNEAMAPA